MFSCLTTIGYSLEVFFRLWIPFLVPLYKQLHFAVLLQLCFVHSASACTDFQPFPRWETECFPAMAGLPVEPIVWSSHTWHMRGSFDNVIVLRPCLYCRHNVYHTEQVWKRQLAGIIRTFGKKMRYNGSEVRLGMRCFEAPTTYTQESTQNARLRNSRLLNAHALLSVSLSLTPSWKYL